MNSLLRMMDLMFSGQSLCSTGKSNSIVVSSSLSKSAAISPLIAASLSAAIPKTDVVNSDCGTPDGIDWSISNQFPSRTPSVVLSQSTEIVALPSIALSLFVIGRCATLSTVLILALVACVLILSSVENVSVKYASTSDLWLE